MAVRTWLVGLWERAEPVAVKPQGGIPPHPQVHAWVLVPRPSCQANMASMSPWASLGNIGERARAHREMFEAVIP